MIRITDQDMVDLHKDLKENKPDILPNLYDNLTNDPQQSGMLKQYTEDNMKYINFQVVALHGAYIDKANLIIKAIGEENSFSLQNMQVIFYLLCWVTQMKSIEEDGEMKATIANLWEGIGFWLN